MAVPGYFSNIRLQTAASLMHVYTIFATSLMHFLPRFFLVLIFWFRRYVYFFNKLSCYRHIIIRRYVNFLINSPGTATSFQLC